MDVYVLEVYAYLTLHLRCRSYITDIAVWIKKHNNKHSHRTKKCRENRMFMLRLNFVETVRIYCIVDVDVVRLSMFGFLLFFAFGLYQTMPK